MRRFSFAMTLSLCVLSSALQFGCEAPSGDPVDAREQGDTGDSEASGNTDPEPDATPLEDDSGVPSGADVEGDAASLGDGATVDASDSDGTQGAVDDTAGPVADVEDGALDAMTPDGDFGDVDPDPSGDSGGPADTSTGGDTGSLSDTTPADTTPADTTPADTTPADTTPADTTPADTGTGADSATDTGPVDVGPPPCSTGEDLDEDGIVDSCDKCPYMPKVLIYELFSEYHFARDAVGRRGCEYEIADISNFTERLESGDFRLVLMDMPDARPSGDWAIALRDFIIDGGGVIMATHRLGGVAGANLPASFGVTWGAETLAPQTFTPTWVIPIHQRPNEIRNATFRPNVSVGYTYYGAPMTPTAGRVWGRFSNGAAIVESNGGRTFVNGFLFDAYPDDSDRDGVVDMVELIENQLISVSRALRPPMDWAAPYVSNFGASTTVRYRMPILRGTIDPRAYDALIWNGKDDVRSWPAGGRSFKALVPLRAGENWVTVESAGVFTHLELDFVPQDNPRKVRFVYAVPKNDNGTFDAPSGEPNDIPSAQKRISLASEMLQSVLADRMAEGGFERHTFNLFTDSNQQAVTHIWNTSLTRAEWQAKTDFEMFNWIWANLGQLPPCAECKNVVIVAASHWDASASKAYAHGALGGGGLAMFGSVTLHTWAETVDDVYYRFSDDTPMSDFSPPVMDDSGGRGVAWANYATGIGAVLHEISHAFELPHAVESTDIVFRGFDNINRSFMSSEPPCNGSTGYAAIMPRDERSFNAFGLGWLRWSRYNALANRNYTVNVKPQVNIVGQEIRISTSAGVRVVGYAKFVDNEWRSVTANIETGATAPTSYTVYKSTLAFMFPGIPQIRLFIVDDQGNVNDSTIVNLP